jgi:hypothetical protein
VKKVRNILDEIVKTKIKPAEISDFVAEMAKRHEESRDTDWYAQVAILVGRYSGRPKRPVAIMERMRCLVALMGDPRMRGWTMEAKDPECTITHEAVFFATATSPLHQIGEELRFDADEFFDIVLTAAEAGGHA